ncbi:hypothetical protein C8J56DRAFT_387300 [Mycena floridula]|nr:hypothetical protein C8J56DRAFT_387300 [Mycena floridula]
MSDNPNFNLRHYLLHSHLPAILQHSGRHIPGYKWPEYPSLKREPGTRALENIVQRNVYQVMQDAIPYLHTLDHFTITRWNDQYPSLRLPQGNFVQHEQADLDLLSRLEARCDDRELLQVMMDYVLTTVSAAIKIIEHIGPEAPMGQKLEWRALRPNVPDARWYAVALPPTADDSLPIAIFFVPPWCLTSKQFEGVVSDRTFAPGIIDSTQCVAPEFPTNKFWPVIYDTCVNRGRFFVITNYTHWAFGSFSRDYKTATVSEPLLASLMKTDKTNIGISAPQFVGASIADLLVYWVQCSRGLVKEM